MTEFKVGERVRVNESVVNKRQYAGIEGIVIRSDARNAYVQVTNAGTAYYPRGSHINLYNHRYDSLETEVPTPDDYQLD